MPDDALPVLIVIDPLVPKVLAPALGVLTLKAPLDVVEPKPLAIVRDPPLFTLSERPALILIAPPVRASATPAVMLTAPPLPVVLRPATIVTAPPAVTLVPELNTKAPLDPILADPV